MPIYKELIFQLSADEFSNGAGPAVARVVKYVSDGKFYCEFDAVMKGISTPDQAHDSAEAARTAIFHYWDACERMLREPGSATFQRSLSY